MFQCERSAVLNMPFLIAFHDDVKKLKTVKDLKTLMTGKKKSVDVTCVRMTGKKPSWFVRRI